MKILKLLSKILLLQLFFLSFHVSQAEEIKEIWSVIENKKELNDKKLNTNVDKPNDINQPQGVKVKLTDENILVDQNLDNSNILLAGLFDPDDNDLNLEMWSSTDGEEIKKLLKILQYKRLSSFS